jgi:orotate phosphoribosyltransferase
MTKGYQKEKRFYVFLHRKDEEPKYMVASGKTSQEFIDAKHFSSFDDAEKFTKLMRHFDWMRSYTVIVASCFVEVNGFDAGTIIT